MLLLFISGFVPAVAAPAGAEITAAGHQNLVIVENSVDGTWKARAGTAVDITAAPTIGNANIALATSSCPGGCDTVAIAVQAVFATASPSVVTPQNVAVATNAGCTGCATMALAHQYFTMVAGPVVLSPRGRDALRAARSEVAALAASGLPLLELAAAVDAVVEQLWRTLDAELAPIPHQPSVRSAARDIAA